MLPGFPCLLLVVEHKDTQEAFTQCPQPLQHSPTEGVAVLEGAQLNSPTDVVSIQLHGYQPLLLGSAAASSNTGFGWVQVATCDQRHPENYMSLFRNLPTPNPGNTILRDNMSYIHLKTSS